MRALSIILYILFSMVIILATFTIGPWVETNYFPVYSKFKIVEAAPSEEGLQIIASFTKFRNCDPQGFAWFVGDFGLMRQVMTRSITRVPVNRPLGTQLTQPFVVKDLRVEDLANLYAEIYHHCHPLWTTRTVIYP